MMEEHFRKGKYVPLQTGQIPGLESKVILIDGAQLAELTFIELFVFTSPTIRTAGRTNPRSIKKRCAPVSIGLCGLRRKRRILGTTACSFCVMAQNCPAGDRYRLHTWIRKKEELVRTRSLEIRILAR